MNTPLRFAALALLPALALLGCEDARPLEEAVSSFEVTVTNLDPGSAEAPLAFPEGTVRLALEITALSNQGGPLAGFDDEVTLYVTPGRLTGLDGRDPVRVRLTGGTGQATVLASSIFGRTHVCAKDDRRGPASTHAAGCSGTLWYQMPTIRQIQLTRDASTSGLIDSFLEVRRGELMVTAIVDTGFYLTDLASDTDGRPGSFGSIFIYNYSYPEGLEVGDRLASVAGTVSEFSGSTQLTFPSWVRMEGDPDPAALPAPVEITSQACGPGGPYEGSVLLCGHDVSNLDMESLESAVVKVSGALTPTRWEDCDLNQDGYVPNYTPGCSTSSPSNDCLETACKSDCNDDPSCTELSGYLGYGQWAVALDGGAGPKINVITGGAYPEFDPMAEENRGRAIDVAGILQHTLAARPRWIVVARTAADVTLLP